MDVRTRTLQRALDAVTGSREQDYGKPEENFAVIARLWSAYTGYEFKPDDVAIMQILVKVARVASGNAKADNWIDIAGYAACGAQIQAVEAKRHDSA